MKYIILLFSITKCSFCFSQTRFESIQKDVHYSIEKVVYSSKKGMFKESTFFFIFISANKKTENIQFLTSDTSYNFVFPEIEAELKKRNTLHTNLRKDKFLIPVFFILDDDKKSKVTDLEILRFAEAFPVGFTNIVLMRRIVLFSENKVR